MIVTLQLIYADDADQTFRNFFVPSLLPVSVLLPVLGILSITSEWSQRTALTTYALVPRRERVVTAKLVAVMVAALASVLASLASPPLGTLVARPPAAGAPGRSMRWHFAQRGDLPGHRRVLGRRLRSAAAQPAAGDRATSCCPPSGDARRDGRGLRGPPSGWTPAVTTAGLVEPPAAGELDAGQWARLGVSVAVWVLVPLIAGLVRTIRREVS